MDTPCFPVFETTTPVQIMALFPLLHMYLIPLNSNKVYARILEDDKAYLPVVVNKFRKQLLGGIFTFISCS